MIKLTLDRYGCLDKEKRMKRVLSVLRVIFLFRICFSDQIASFYYQKHRVNCPRGILDFCIKNLLIKKFKNTKRFFTGPYRNFYYLRKAGFEYLQQSFPNKSIKYKPFKPETHLNEFRIIHNIEVFKVYIFLLKLYPESRWVPEWKIGEMISNKKKKNRLKDNLPFLNCSRRPDGIFSVNDIDIAIECERTPKKKRDLEDMLSRYRFSFEQRKQELNAVLIIAVDETLFNHLSSKLWVNKFALEYVFLSSTDKLYSQVIYQGKEELSINEMLMRIEAKDERSNV